MKKVATIIAIFLVAILLHSCSECSSVDDQGNPARVIRLFDGQGNDLWFGPTAKYDPAKVQFEHQTEGLLNSNVINAEKAVSVQFPLTNTQEQKIYVKLDSATVDTLTYTTLVYDSKCSKVYELSYVLFDGRKICGSCGNTQFNEDRYINLVKN